ncbi:MAG: hypothetical protein KAI25_08780, partial [Hyphomicrobiaceae bacterium]|nr:hypothetical protein [Hyphomicrobiaceae bacterium]
ENVTGTTGADTITGDSAVNILLGGGGDDTLIGGGGNDTLDGDTGTNMVSYAYTNSGLTADMGNLIGGYFAVTVSGGTDTDQVKNVSDFIGSGGGDVITGDLNANTISAGGGWDYIYASGGGDFIDGGSSTDTVNYSISGATSIAVVLNTSTNATVTVGGGIDDTIVNVECVTGTDGDDTVTGDGSVNYLYLNAGDDTIYGSTGTDTITGGTGMDTLNYSALAQAINVNAGVQVSGFYFINVGGASLQKVNGIEALYGSSQNDYIRTGTNSATSFSTIYGMDGNDTIVGNIVGGGATLSGGTGNDTFEIRSGSNTIDGDTGVNVVTYVYTSSGAISVVMQDAGASVVNKASSEIDTITNIQNITGSSGADT